MRRARLRGFGDGFAVVVLPAYLSAIGFDAAQVGLVAAAALFGTAVFTLAIGFVAPRFDLRNMLIVGAALMICTGLAFAQVEAIGLSLPWHFSEASNPSTGDIGVLIPSSMRCSRMALPMRIVRTPLRATV